MRLILILILGVILSSGCAKLAHMQELLTLKAYSDNKEVQNQYIKNQDEKFNKLLEIIKENRLGEYPHKRSFLRNFGQPIVAKKVSQDGQLLEEWLYRYSTKYFDSKKVYVYFDPKGRQINFNLQEPQKKSDEQK